MIITVPGTHDNGGNPISIMDSQIESFTAFEVNSRPAGTEITLLSGRKVRTRLFPDAFKAFVENEYALAAARTAL